MRDPAFGVFSPVLSLLPAAKIGDDVGWGKLGVPVGSPLRIFLDPKDKDKAEVDTKLATFSAVYTRMSRSALSTPGSIASAQERTAVIKAFNVRCRP